jgi:hypothetical protein
MEKIMLVENKEDKIFTKHIVIVLVLIATVGFVLRLVFFNPNIPLSLDALSYFWYANDMSILGNFPKSEVANTGWPTFLSIFFTVFHSDDFLDYMNLQRLVTIIISVATIIPTYFLCTRFFDRTISLVGTMLFVFEPRIVQNSLFGITEPLYIFLIATALFLVLSRKNLYVYLAFSVSALASFVRVEGFFLFIVLSLIFFITQRKNKKVWFHYSIAVVFFILLLVPMTAVRLQTQNNDSLTGRIFAETVAIVNPEQEFENGWVDEQLNIFKFIGWALIPVYIFFVPWGFFMIIKKRNQTTLIILISALVLLVPAFDAIVISEAHDTRYLLPSYTLFCVLALFPVKFLFDRIKNQKRFLMFLAFGIFVSSVIFLNIKIADPEHEREAFELAYYVNNSTSVINQYYPEAGYLSVIGLTTIENFPVLSSEIPSGPERISYMGFTSISEYIQSAKQNGLTHLVLDGMKNRPEFLNDVFYHEKNYPYLKKAFDSQDYGYKYHLKIFEIDYKKFNESEWENK